MPSAPGGEPLLSVVCRLRPRQWAMSFYADKTYWQAAPGNVSARELSMRNSVAQVKQRHCRYLRRQGSLAAAACQHPLNPMF